MVISETNFHYLSKLRELILIFHENSGGMKVPYFAQSRLNMEAKFTKYMQPQYIQYIPNQQPEHYDLTLTTDDFYVEKVIILH